MRDLVVIDDDPERVLGALHAALAGDGPAILPLAPGADASGLPDQVPRRIAAVVQTSGSAGAPKRVALSANALLASAAQTEAALGGPGHWVLALPVHYIAGLQVLVRAIAADTEPLILRGPFDPAAFADAVLGVPEHDRVYASLVPTQLRDLLAADEGRAMAALRRLDAVLVGGQRLSEQVRRSALDHGVRIIRTYGATETSGGCIYDGLPLGQTDVRIVDDEVRIAGPMLAEEYLGDPARTAAAFVHGEGLRWYRTGDAGELRDGVLRVAGRLDDVLISGGEKVSLALVEAAVRELPGLSDAVVVRAPHPRWGEVPVVVIAAPADESLLEHVREEVGARLGAAARPDRIDTADPFPTLPSGKPDRVAITALTAARSGG